MRLALILFVGLAVCSEPAHGDSPRKPSLKRSTGFGISDLERSHGREKMTRRQEKQTPNAIFDEYAALMTEKAKVSEQLAHQVNAKAEKRPIPAFHREFFEKILENPSLSEDERAEILSKLQNAP